MFSVSQALLRLRHGQLGMLCGARAGCGRLLTDRAGAEAAEIQELKIQMAWALEAVHAIDESANQAYLERDPCARPAPVTFQEHYQTGQRTEPTALGMVGEKRRWAVRLLVTRLFLAQRQALDYVERAVATYNTLRIKHGEDRIVELEESEGFGPLLVDTFVARQQLRRCLSEG